MTGHVIFEGDPFRRFTGRVPIKCTLIRNLAWALCVALCFPLGTQEEPELDPGTEWF